MQHFDATTAEIRAIFAQLTYHQKLEFLAAARALTEGEAPAPSAEAAPDPQG